MEKNSLFCTYVVKQLLVLPYEIVLEWSFGSFFTDRKLKCCKQLAHTTHTLPVAFGSEHSNHNVRGVAHYSDMKCQDAPLTPRQHYNVQL